MEKHYCNCGNYVANKSIKNKLKLSCHPLTRICKMAFFLTLSYTGKTL